jgi:DNA mismatch endonuclease (patch repair protein)
MDGATARKIKSKNTKIELALRKELWKMGYRYRIHDKKAFGKPDIVFRQQKIAIFFRFIA